METMPNSGEWVRCVDNEDMPHLTIGKMYGVQKVNPLSRTIQIRNDQGDLQTCRIDRFDSDVYVKHAEPKKKEKVDGRHVHADHMARYAVDAMTTTEPWRKWEFRARGTDWLSMHVHPAWDEGIEYRRRGDHFNVTVPRGSTQRPEYNQGYYFPDTSRDQVVMSSWYDDVYDNKRFDLGVVYPNERQAQAFLDALKVKA